MPGKFLWYVLVVCFLVLYGGLEKAPSLFSDAFMGCLKYPLNREIIWQKGQSNSYKFVDTDAKRLTGRVTVIRNGAWEKQSYVVWRRNSNDLNIDSSGYILMEQRDLSYKLFDKTDNNGRFDNELRIEGLHIEPLDSTVIFFGSHKAQMSAQACQEAKVTNKEQTIGDAKILSIGEICLYGIVCLLFGFCAYEGVSRVYWAISDKISHRRLGSAG